MSRWWSQPFAEEGSATAEGIINQLGRPALEDLTVLVREAAQNSWDARAGNSPVEFTIRIEALGARAESWRDALLPAPSGGSVASLAAQLTSSSPIIIVSDRGTRGLGGPIRAGSRAPEGQRSDFVQFLRNVGETRDNEFGGGTYGFGKGIFYRLSAASTIVVDTNTGDGVQPRRLMGAALGSSFYNDEERRFTGRHWWGAINDGIPDPLGGDEAADISRNLGLPGFGDGRTGTDIAVIGAQLPAVEGGDAIRSAAEFVASSILWNLWPKMIPGASAHPDMRFKVLAHDEEIEIPDPQHAPPLQVFTESLLKVRRQEGRCHTRKAEPQEVGRLSVTVGPRPLDTQTNVVAAASPLDGAPHHVARMRVAELVVDYLPGPAHPNDHFCYGGVFRSSPEADRYFAGAEPPTHDDWVESGLRGTAKGVVQGARLFVKRALDQEFSPGMHAQTRGEAGLGVIARQLAGVAPAMGGGGGGSRAAHVRRRTRGGGGPRDRRRAATIVEGPRLQLFDSAAYVVARVRVAGGEEHVVLTANTFVVTEGGARESVQFIGATLPQVLEWRPTHGGPSIPGASIQLGAGGDSEWWVYATHVPDATVRLELERELLDAR